MTQPEALRLADAIDPRNESELYWRDREATAAELRRLYAENEKKSEAIQRLWKERDELRDSNEAKADRIDRLGETVEKLKAQRDELLEALEEAKLHIWLGDEKGVAANIKCHQTIAAIAKAEGKT